MAIKSCGFAHDQTPSCTKRDQMQIFWIFYFQVQKEHRKTAKVLAVLNVNRRQPQNGKATQKIGSVALD